MQDIRQKLTVLHTSDGVAFTDKSTEAFDLIKDEISGTTQTLYVGFRKPINAIYASIPSDAENSGTFTWSYFNGTAFVAIPDIHDETENLSRSGFVQWDRNLDDETETTVNDKELYWYKVTHSNSDPYRLLGLGILLCTIDDLKEEFHYADAAQYLPEGETTQIRALVAGRNAVLRHFDVSPWDLLHVAEARDAAVFYALSVICKNASQNPDDVDAVRSRLFYESFVASRSMIKLSVDSNDDGKEQEAEKKSQGASMSRFSR